MLLSHCCAAYMFDVNFSEVYKKDGDISFTLKAYNGRCVLAWLSDAVYEASLNPMQAAIDERFHLITCALKHG